MKPSYDKLFDSEWFLNTVHSLSAIKFIIKPQSGSQNSQKMREATKEG